MCPPPRARRIRSVRNVRGTSRALYETESDLEKNVLSHFSDREVKNLWDFGSEIVRVSIHDTYLDLFMIARERTRTHPWPGDIKRSARHLGGAAARSAEEQVSGKYFSETLCTPWLRNMTTRSAAGFSADIRRNNMDFTHVPRRRPRPVLFETVMFTFTTRRGVRFSECYFSLGDHGTGMRERPSGQQQQQQQQQQQ